MIPGQRGLSIFYKEERYMKYLKNAVHSMKELPVSLRAALSNRSGEGYVDTAVKILMGGSHRCSGAGWAVRPV